MKVFDRRIHHSVTAHFDWVVVCSMQFPVVSVVFVFVLGCSLHSRSGDKIMALFYRHSRLG